MELTRAAYAPLRARSCSFARVAADVRPRHLDDTSQSNKAIIKDVIEDCLVNEWLHDNGGGMKLQNFSGGSYLEGGFSDTATSQQWKITKVGQTGTDGVLVTIDTTGKPAANNPEAGDTVLISALGQGAAAPVSASRFPASGILLQYWRRSGGE